MLSRRETTMNPTAISLNPLEGHLHFRQSLIFREQTVRALPIKRLRPGRIKTVLPHRHLEALAGLARLGTVVERYVDLPGLAATALPDRDVHVSGVVVDHVDPLRARFVLDDGHVVDLGSAHRGEVLLGGGREAGALSAGELGCRSRRERGHEGEEGGQQDEEAR